MQGIQPYNPKTMLSKDAPILMLRYVLLGMQALRDGLEREGGYRYLSDEWPYYVAGLVFRYMGVPMPECVPRPHSLLTRAGRLEYQSGTSCLGSSWDSESIYAQARKVVTSKNSDCVGADARVLARVLAFCSISV